MIEATVRIEGADQALRALRSLEPSVAREVGQEVKQAAQTLASSIASSAPGRPPVSGWRGSSNWPDWTSVSAKGTRRNLEAIVSTSSSPSPIAAMVEHLGNGTKVRTSQGAVLSAMFNARLGTPVQSGRRKGRLALKAIAEQNSAITEQVRKACDRAVDEVNRRMP